MFILLCLAPILTEIAKGKFNFFNLKNPFLIYISIQIGISGLLTLYSATDTETGLNPIVYEEYYTKTFLFSIISIIFFHLGYYTTTIKASIPRLMRKSFSKKKLIITIYILIIIGYYAFFNLILSYGGISNFIENREEFRAGGLVGKGYLIFPATAFPTIASLLSIFYFQKKDLFTKLKLISILILSLIPASLLGFRGLILIPLIQFMLVWHYSHSPLNFKKILPIIVIIISIFTIYGAIRDMSTDKGISVETLLERTTENPELITAIFSRSKGSEVISTVIENLDRTNAYELGWRSIIESVTIFIPKFIWSEKPEPASVRFTTYFFGDRLSAYRGYTNDSWGGISPTAVGEIYWHFGLIGIIFGFYILGKVAKLAFNTLNANFANHSVILCYAIFFTSFAMFSEAIQGYANGLVMYFITLLLIFIFSTKSTTRLSA
jgi:oligosaccharide repeat unit polymerase